MLRFLLCLVMAMLLRAPVLAAPTAPMMPELTLYSGHAAYRLSDGHSEAVVVPALGRVMRFGLVGGDNWLWNAPPAALTGDGFQNVGGDKTFVGPHENWKLFAPEIWPPQPSWDGMPQRAEVLPDGVLRTTSPSWQGFETRIIREYQFEAGELVIRQTIQKEGGGPIFASIWSVSQAAPPDAVFLPSSANSIYKNGFRPFGPLSKKAVVNALSAGLLQITPSRGAYYKLGTDGASALVAVRGDVAWRQWAEKVGGDYPDGGLPVEFYNHGDAGAGQYVELELLSPLRVLRVGEAMSHTIRWSLHQLGSSNLKAPQTEQEIENLLHPRP